MQISPRKLTVAVALSAVTCSVNATQPPLLTQACEEALALSALPAALRSDASAYVLTASGFEMTRQGSGPFTCIVARNHANALVPQCPDAAGADTVIPGIIKKSEWALSGLSRRAAALNPPPEA